MDRRDDGIYITTVSLWGKKKKINSNHPCDKSKVSSAALIPTLTDKSLK